MTDTEPWNLAKLEDDRSRLLLNWVIFNCAEALRIAGILLQPIMPSKTNRLLNEMHISPDNRTVAHAYKGKDADYGTETGSVARMNKFDTLFPPTANGEMSDQEVLQEFKASLLNKSGNRLNQMSELLAMEARMGEEEVKRLIAEAKKEADAAKQEEIKKREAALDARSKRA